MADIKILSTEILAERKYKLETVLASYSGFNGETITSKREIYHRPDAAAILLYDPVRKTVLLTKQVRLPTHLNGNSGGELIEACAGIIDDGESPEQCIVREAEEETGYRISEIKKIFEAYSSTGALTERIHYFIGKYSPFMKVNKGGGVDDGENIQLIEWSFAVARQHVNTSEIRDSKTLVLLLYAMLNDVI